MQPIQPIVQPVRRNIPQFPQVMQPVAVLHGGPMVHLGLPANLPQNAYFDRNQYLLLVRQYLPDITELPEGIYTDTQAYSWAQREMNRRQHLNEYKTKELIINKDGVIDGNALYNMLLAKELTDTTIRLSDGSQFVAHKIILAVASNYFKAQFLRFPRDVLIVNETNTKTFQQYLAFVYGQPLKINDWREAFDLFDYLSFTQTNWPKQRTDVVWNVRVPTADFMEYIDRLSKLFGGVIPTELLYDTPIHLNDLIDLSPLGEEAMILLLNSEYLFTGPSKSQFIKYMREQGVDPVLLDRVAQSTGDGIRPFYS
jgi:hypothetical protein